MIDEGLFDRFPCDTIFGMHNRPNLDIGRFAVRSGPMMAGGGFTMARAKIRKPVCAIMRSCGRSRSAICFDPLPPTSSSTQKPSATGSIPKGTSTRV